MTRIGYAALTISCVLIALAAGLWLGGHPGDLPGPIRDVFVSDERALQAEVIDSIDDNYYKNVDDKRLKEASLKGVVAALKDPFSHYLTPKEAKQFKESVSGEFEGVGMTVAQDKRGLRVLTVFANSPARRAGIRKGDVIFAVNGKSIAGQNSPVATSALAC